VINDLQKKETVMESFFDKIKKDVKKGFEGGVAAVMQGASVVSLKMNELSDEGKKQYKIFNLYVKIKDGMNELGGVAYAVLESGKSLDEDKKIKAAYAKIKKLEWQLGKIKGDKNINVAEPKNVVTPKKPAKKAKAAVKKSAKSAVK
jgi:hypothetical protein